MNKREHLIWSKYQRIFCVFSAIALCFLFFQQSIIAQVSTNIDRKILSGTIVDVNGSPIIGASVLIKGTANGTITDTEGKFKIDASFNSVLSISYIGYDKIEIVADSKQLNRIVLTEDSKSLDELVVVGYGSVRRGDLTGSVSSVNVDGLSKAPVASFDNALAGRVSGVQVTTADGQPGAQSNIVIRGASSLTQNIAPIYVVDGFVLEDFDPSSISPQDIVSINILKDASSTAIYGSKGANGVIVITTKMGKIGKPTINYSASFGYNSPTKRMELMNSYEFVKLQIERFPDQARASFYSDIPQTEAMNPEVYRDAPTIDWQDKILRNGNNQIHNISISGGSSTSKYFASFSYFGQEGSIINTTYNKINGRMVLDQAINEKVSLKLSTMYTTDHASGIVPTDASISGTATSSLFFSAYGYRPLAGLNPEANAELENNIIDEDPNINAASDYRLNPTVMAMNEQKNTINTIFIPSVTLTYKINKNWTLLLRGGVDKRQREYNYFYNSKTRIGIQRPGVVYAGVQGGVNYYQYNLMSNENILTYSNTFAKIHKIEVQAGLSFQDISRSSHELKYQQIPYEELGLSGIDKGIPVPANSWLSQSRSESFFGRINYNILSRYLFTLTSRADGSSKFPLENRWGYFPSAAFAWRISGEKFLKNVDFISDAKFRVSYGLTGNDRVGDFDYYASLGTPYSGYYSFNNETPVMGASRDALGNSDLRWETTAQTNIGFDLSLFKNRINITADLYRKTTSDLLLKANLPAVSGFGSAYKNIGSIQNDGIEISLSTVNLRSKNFEWSSDFNISFNRNTVLELNGEEQYMYNSIVWDANYNTTPLYRTIVGGPVAEFWGVKWDGIYQYEDFDLIDNKYVLKSTITTNGNPRIKIQPGDIKYKDINGDLIVNSEDRTVIGNPLPKHIGGFNNDFRYKNFSLNIFFQWSYGGELFNANRLYFEGGYNIRPLQNQFASYENRWTPENQTNEMFRAGLGGSESGAGPNGVYSSMTIEDGSFLRLKTIALEYKISSELVKKINIKGISIGISAQNIYTWSAYSGVDPEVSVRNSIMTPGFDFSSYPRSMSMLFNLKLTL